MEDAFKDKTSFIADVEKILSDLSSLMEENRKIRADFEALSKSIVTKEQMLRHTALLSEVNSCIRRLGLEHKKVKDGLGRPDRRVNALEAEVKILGNKIERLGEGLGKPHSGMLSRISAIEQKIESQNQEIEKLRALAEESSRNVLSLRLRSGKRKFRYRCE